MRKILSLVMLMAIIEQGFSQIDWKGDIDFLRTELPKKHKNFFFLRSEEDFNKEVNSIRNQTDNLSDFEIMLQIQQLIATFGDSHTYLDWYSSLKPEWYLPVGVYPFSDGVFILSASKEYATLIGKRLIKINGHPIEKVIDSLSTLITNENIALKKDFFPKFIASTQVLNFFKFGTTGAYSLEVEDESNNLTTHQVLPSVVGKQFVSVQLNNLPYSWQEKKTAFTKKYFEDDKILYVVYNSCVPISVIRNNGKSDSLAFEDFQKQIFNDLKETEVNKLIFDMRFNGGGNSIYGSSFVKELSGKGIDKTGKLFVVIGRSTFSSAILNTLDFKRQTNAITGWRRDRWKTKSLRRSKKL